MPQLGQFDPNDPRLQTNPFLVPSTQVPLGAGALPLARATTDARAFQPPAPTFTPSIPTSPLARADTATAAPPSTTPETARTLDTGAAPAVRPAAGSASTGLARADFVPTPEQLPFTLPARPQAPVQTANELRKAKLEAEGPRIQRIHNPFLKGLATAGDIILGTFAPRAEMLTPGTQGNYNLQLARANEAVRGEQAGASEEARADLERQQAEEARQHGALFRAQAEAAANAKPDQFTPVKAGEGLWDRNMNGGRGGWAIEPTDPETATEISPEIGQKLGILPTKDGKYLLPKGGAALLKPDADKPAGTVHQLEDGTLIVAHPDGTATQLTINGQPVKGKAPEKTVSPEQQFIDEYRNDPKHFKNGKPPSIAEAEQAFKNIQPPERRDFGVTGIDPVTRQVVHVEPGQTAPSGFITPQQFGTENAPTTQMRNTASQAQYVHEQTPYMLSELTRLQSKIGPYSGRWNDFMQGKVGLDDPDMAGLRADLMLYSSAVSLMHARGRLPENLRQEFDKALNAPQQTADNLKTAIQHVDRWAAANAQVGAGSTSPGGPAPEEWVRDPKTGKLVKK